jgi:hypothetical protein
MMPGLRYLFGLIAFCIAQPALQAQAGPMLTDVHFKWEGPALILYAAFDQSGHDLPVFLEWRVGDDAKNTVHRIQIDYIEQYARDMPVAITVASLEKNAAGQRVIYMGQPRTNTPKIEGNSAVTIRIVLDDAAGPVEQYSSAIPADAPTVTPK